MENTLFCHKGMSKNMQLEFVYSDFIEIGIRKTFIFYKPNNSVISFDETGYMFDVLSREEINRKMLSSFDVCRYTFTDKKIQARKLSKRFVKSLPIIYFEDIKKLINANK